MKFENLKFITTVIDAKELPFLGNLPEMAVVGRSNVGKSTLLNHLFGVKQVVKTSSTPGKTRALNFFSAEGLVVVDMPGYGFASVSKEARRDWGNLVEDYLNTRERLKILLFLFDIRREPSEEDIQMFSWICHSRIPAVLVLTKTDKVNQKERLAQTKRITSVLKELPYVHYSATKNEGRRELIAQIRNQVHVT